MPGDLADHAKEPVDFVLASDFDVGDAWTLNNTATMDADEIPGEYPQFGTFLDCRRDDGSDVWVECPRSLARDLVDVGAKPKDKFRIESVDKDETGNWSISVIVKA